MHVRGGHYPPPATCSIGGAPILVDEYKIDVCYAGGQKSLSCPPGVSPVTFSPRAVAKMDSRKGSVRSLVWWMFGMCWGGL